MGGDHSKINTGSELKNSIVNEERHAQAHHSKISYHQELKNHESF